jgi:hypothetical protein
MAISNIQVVTSFGTLAGQKTLRLKGALNIHTLSDSQRALIPKTSSPIIIDFSDVPFCRFDRT